MPEITTLQDTNVTHILYLAINANLVAALLRCHSAVVLPQ